MRIHRRRRSPDVVRGAGLFVKARAQLATGEPAAERDLFGEVVQSRFLRTLTRTLPSGDENREGIRRLNPAIPEEARAVVSILENTAAICERSTP